MQKRKTHLLLTLLFSTTFLFLTGCSKDTTLPIPEKIPVQTETVSPSEKNENVSQDSSAEEPKAPEYLLLQEPLELPPATETTEIGDAILQAMEGGYRGFSMDVAQVSFDTNPEMEIRNLYYQLMSDHPEFLYVYDISVQLAENQLTATLSYMPYKTGEFEADFQGTEVASLKELLQTASDNLHQDRVAIRITDPSLDVSKMQQILRQAGEGFFVCMLSSDATEIIIQPGQEHDREASLDYLAEIQILAEEILEKRVTEEMSDREKALALYSYVAETVKYDYRYYNDHASMPYVSITAYGALKDGLAICGGCSLSVEKLFTMAGIPCYMVSGDWNGESHLWNVANIDGEWLYFDSTGDLGRQGDFRFFAVTAEELGGHNWEPESVDLILEMED